MFPTPDIVHQFLFNFPLHFLLFLFCFLMALKDDAIFNSRNTWVVKKT